MLNMNPIGHRNFETLIHNELAGRYFTAADLAAIWEAIAVEMSSLVLPPIVIVELFLADGCNLDCTYCFEGLKAKRILSSELISRTIDRLLLEWSQDRKQVHIAFFGGEPLLNWKGLVNTIEYSMKKAHECQKQVSLGITTNGTLLNRDRARLLRDNNVAVMLSIDGIPEAHNAHRRTMKGLPSFPAAWRGLEILREFYGSDFDVHVTVMPDTAPLLLQSLQFLFENGVKRVVVIPACERRWTDRDWRVYRSQVMKAVSHFKTLSDQGQEVSGISYVADIERFKQVVISCPQPGEPGIPKFSQRDKQTGDFGCYAGINGVAVTASGEILPCSFFTGNKELKAVYTLGNVRETQLNDERRRELFVLNRRRSEKCLQCAARQACRGGCLVENFVMTGYLVEPSPEMCRRTGLATALTKMELRSSSRLSNPFPAITGVGDR